MSPKTILFTGGAGFIGSRVVDLLISQGHRVVVVDNLSTGKLSRVNRRAIFYHMDITNPKVEEIFDREQPDIVNHHAAHVVSQNTASSSLDYAKTNVEGSIILIDLARKFGTRKFIFASSGGDIYGEWGHDTPDESFQVYPSSPFSLSKRVSEEYLYLYYELHRLPYVAFRYGSVYGPGQGTNGNLSVVNRFILNVLMDEQAIIFGEGKQLRDFVYIDDVVNANILAMDHGQGIYNLATGFSISINETFQLIKKTMGYPWGPVFRPSRPGDNTRIRLNCSKARNELGWMPEVNFEDGLSQTIGSYRAYIERTTLGINRE